MLKCATVTLTVGGGWWPIPRNVHEVRQFIGLVSYYRRFMKDFARVSVPLFELLKESDAELRAKRFRKIIWTSQADIAFRRCKQMITEDPVLRAPDTKSPFVISTDCSEYALGIELSQYHPDTQKLHPVAFDGRKLTSAEINYPIHEKELLAVKHALTLWNYYVDNGHEITVLTDHESLKYMNTIKHVSKRIARWIDEFQQYQLNIKYRKGEEDVVADAISRRPDWMEEGPRNMTTNPAQATQTPARLNLVKGYNEDEWAGHMLRFLSEGVEPPAEIEKDIKLTQFAFNCGHQGDTLYHSDGDQNSPYIPYATRADFLDHLHNHYGHLGFPGLQGVTQGRGWWHDIERDIRNFAQTCPQCQCSQRSRPGQEPELPRTLSSPNLDLFDRWVVDLIGPLPQTPKGNRWILTCVEYLTAWPIAIALPDARAETVAYALHDHLTMIYGPPKELLSDNGSNLAGWVLSAYLKVLATKHRFTTPYHPRTNGKVENFNGLLGNILTKMLIGRPSRVWDQFLQQAVFATRVRVHTGTEQSPYFLLYGKHPRLPTDNNELRPLLVSHMNEDRVIQRIAAMQHARSTANLKLLEKAEKARKVRADRVKMRNIAEGDWVLVRAEARNKFDARWYGPYEVLKKHHLGTYVLAQTDGKILKLLVNGQRLVKANTPEGNIEELWSSSAMQASLRRQGMELMKASPEVEELQQEEERQTPSYDDLAAVPADEWKKLHPKEVIEDLSGDLDRTEIEALQRGILEGIANQTRPTDGSGPLGTDTAAAVEHTEGEATLFDNEEEPLAEQVIDRDSNVLPDIKTEPVIPLESNRMIPRLPDISEKAEDTMKVDEVLLEILTDNEVDKDQPIIKETVLLPMELDDDSPTIPEATKSRERTAISTRVSGWQRERDAGLQERERSLGGYSLRERPRKIRD